jgi:hypothetical protein
MVTVRYMKWGRNGKRKTKMKEKGIRDRKRKKEKKRRLRDEEHRRQVSPTGLCGQVLREKAILSKGRWDR